jgi:hypothetical protein
VFDLNGNVFEWEDSCAGVAGVGDQCRVRGGSFLGGTSQALGRCDDKRTDDRAANNQPDYGIRCCWP